MTFAERRRCSRTPIHSKARLSLGSDEHPGVVVDISMWGALFAAPSSMQGLCERDCRLNLHDAADRLMIGLAGQIVHAEGRQAGILFRSLDGRTVQRLRRIAEAGFGNAVLLRRDLPALLR